MNERMMKMSKRKTLEELQADVEIAKKKKENAEHNLNRAKQRVRNLMPDSRTERNKRLIHKGIAFEKYFPESKVLPMEVSYDMMEELSMNPESKKIVSMTVQKYQKDLEEGNEQ